MKWLVALALIIGALAACSGEATVESRAADSEIEAPATDDSTESSDRSEANDPATNAPEPDAAPAEPPVDPVPYLPASKPGQADSYQQLVEQLEAIVPSELRSQVPWPDIRDPNPINAQVQIFELWVWMAAELTEPELVQIMTAPGSPSREDVTGVFGRLESDQLFQHRLGSGYQAFDHRVVTFESAGLPLWLGRDVPEDAVVVYYTDRSGPVDVVDQNTGQVVERQPPVGERTWLSIMVPTDVGWQLWRDQLLDASNGLEVPDVPPPPGTSEDVRTPEV